MCPQLALARLLSTDLLPHLTHPPVLYDPVLTEVDRALITHWGWECPAHDTRALWRAHTPTFYFLPHLEVGLCVCVCMYVCVCVCI